MKTFIIKFGPLFVVAGLVAWILASDPSGYVSSAVLAALGPAQKFYAAHGFLTFAAFCLAHLICSATGLPGSCTLLNIVAGAVFGFWPGCALIYTVTLFSACWMYFMGGQLQPYIARYSSLIARLRDHLQRRDY